MSTMQITTFDFTSFSDITIYVNFTALQSIPVAINTLTNMFAAAYGLNTTVKLTSQPMIAAVDAGYDYAAFAGVMFIGFAVLMPPIGVSMELVEDRETRAKNQLRVNGFGFGLYFSAVFTVEMCIMFALLGVLGSVQKSLLHFYLAFLLMCFNVVICPNYLLYIKKNVEFQLNLYFDNIF